MTDLEITRLCAKAMGSIGLRVGKARYDPFHDDAQKWALIERFPEQALHALRCELNRAQHLPRAFDWTPLDLSRALCTHIAKMQESHDA